MSNDHGGGIYRLRPDPNTEGGSPAPLERAEPSTPFNSGRRILFTLTLITFLGLVLAVRLLLYQIPDVSSKAAASNQKEQVDILLPRGNIVDRDGHLLATDRWLYQVNATPKLIDNPSAVADLLAPLLRQDKSAIMQKLIENPEAEYVRLADDVGADAGELIKSWGVYTVTAQAMPRRLYPEGSLACHILGFVAGDRVGYYGVEGYFDNFLRAESRNPKQLTSLQPAPTHADPNTAPLPDSPYLPSFVQHDLVLTVDRVIQDMIQNELRDGIKRYEAESGTIIVLDPHTSAILAMASWPDYDPNRYSQVTDAKTYADPAISALYEPGSVFKIMTISTALAEGAVTPSTTIQDESEFTYGENTVYNFDRQGHGVVGLVDILSMSLNVATAKIAVEHLGANRFYKGVQRYGFGKNTGVELFGEVPGIVKIPGKGNWYPSDLATNAFGQGISITPLQVANAFAAVASGGVLHRPHVVQYIIKENETVAYERRPLNRALPPQAARMITDFMVQATKDTAEAQVEGYTIAGKSGTAEIPRAGGYKDDYTIVSYVGFFPAYDPQFVILVKLDRPRTSRWASHTATPIFQTVARNLIQLSAIPPDNERKKTQANEGQP